MSGCGTRIVLRGQKPLALCDRCPCFGSLHPPLAALTFAASSIICAFGLAAAAPRSPYRHLELCGIALSDTRAKCRIGTAKFFYTSITSLSHISKGVGHDGGCAGTFGGLIFFDIWSATQVGDNTLSKDCTNAPAQTRLCWAGALILLFYLWQHRTIPA